MRRRKEKENNNTQIQNITETNITQIITKLLLDLY